MALTGRPEARVVNAGARLDRLPIFSFHVKLLAALSLAYFFELGDLNTLAYAGPKLIDLHILTTATFGLVTSASFVGMFFGAVCGGMVADRIGRRRALIAMVLWYCVFSLLTAVAPGEGALLALRFLTGIGLSAMTIVANTYVSEMFPSGSRGKYQGLVMGFGLVGIPLTSLVARAVIPLGTWGWRLVFVWGALGVLFFVFGRDVVESPRWLAQHGRHEAAEQVLTRLERAAEARTGPLPELPRNIAAEADHALPYLQLFRPPYLRRTAMLLAVWILQTLGFYGFLTWVPTLLVDHGFTIAKALTFTTLTAIGNPLGGFVAYAISDRIDRKWSVTIVAVLATGFGLAYGLTFQPVLIVVFGFLETVALQMFAPLIYAYTPELYPTQARASGMGLNYGIGRAANIAGPIIVAALYASAGYGVVFGYVAACWGLVAVIVGLFGPRTRGMALETLAKHEVRTAPD